jgi:glycosyltransferase involved in cell wall biosynthesis
MKPFFSVCMEIYNREKTIYDAIMSLQKQKFKDFEVIIVDDISTDNTIKEIERALRQCEFDHIFRQNKEHLELGNWNEPLKLAKGIYIAVLEGDDQFLPNHLENAFNLLSYHYPNNPNSYFKVGIYATGNQLKPRPLTGFIKPMDYFRYIYRMENVSPPSETIFIRKNKNKPYFYNTENYVYYPEVDLYLRIARDGFCAYHSINQDVIRGISTSKKMRGTWKYFIDAFAILERYKYYAYDDYESNLKFMISRVFKQYLYSKIHRVGNPNELLENVNSIIKQNILLAESIELNLLRAFFS